MYVDGFVVPVPKKNLDSYIDWSKKMSKFCKDKGALTYVECVGDDVKPGEVTSFPQSVKLQDDEVVVLSWITYKTKEDRDRINKLMMDDPSMKEMGKDMPFDGKRMFMGGFKPIVE
jgi:uncharacterized protein YbaA (DUF1428 family)